MGVKIMPCTCKDEYQDKLYGKGMRVHNTSEKLNEAYCTVCSPSQFRTLRYYPPESTINSCKIFGVINLELLKNKPNRGGKKFVK